MLDADTVVVASADQVSTSVNSETVLLHLKSGKYYSLNAVGVFIWGTLKDPISVTAVCEAVMAKYEVDRERCERDVRSLIASLCDAGFVEVRT
jgi:hypothetical protein